MKQTFEHILATRDWLLADGATGTNLFHAGLETGYPPELWNVEYPDRVTTLHARFIAAGADIILTNSFGGTSFRLKLHQAENSVNALNSAAAGLARQAADAGPVAELQAVVEANPADLQARFDLAQALHAGGQVEEAVTELLELFRRDCEWNDGAAKAQMFTIFDALKPNDPIVLNGRRKLSSMIFA